MGGARERGTFVDVEAPEVGVVRGREGVDLGVCFGEGDVRWDGKEGGGGCWDGKGWKGEEGEIPFSNSST